MWLSSEADSNEGTKKHMATCLQEEDTRGGDTESLVDLEEFWWWEMYLNNLMMLITCFVEVTSPGKKRKDVEDKYDRERLF